MVGRILFRTTFSLILFFCFAINSNAQTIVRGEVLDKGNNEPLIGATVVIKGTTIGVITDWDGSFELKTDQPLPLLLSISYTGYAAEDLEITSTDKSIKIKLSEDAITIDVVEVKGRRISEKQRQSPLTVETLDNIAIKETPAANFYDGLGSLKDVDLTAASLGFKVINTRGFNSTSPVRSLQIIDGVDNQSPGLNFSLGNFLGASELDVNQVNLIVGASSAFYGPNAFNGVISMQTKNPFLHRGISAMTKVGERSLFEGAIRYAEAFNNKQGQPIVAFKVNAFYMQADDWVADNFDPVFDTETGLDNPGGYDAVNIYGDEYQGNFDRTDNVTFPGLNIWHRRGYIEEDLVDYDSDNYKASAAVHFRLAPSQDVESPELILSSSTGGGTTVFQGDNRFSLRNIRFYQHRIELNKKDHYFLRLYATHEDAGDSYDPYFTALRLQDRAKENSDFGTDYGNYWSLTVVPQMQAMEGYPDVFDFIGNPDGFRAALNTFLDGIPDELVQWHQEAQEAANTGNSVVGTTDFLEPGTEEFQEAFDDITGRIANLEGGTKFFSESALVHAHGEYQFKDLYNGDIISNLDVLVGANFRRYMPNSKGSILLDTQQPDGSFLNIDTDEFGIYTGGTVELYNKLRINTSLRLDKNENFDYLLSPAASAVYTPSPGTVIRFSFSSAIRNPTLNDQYLNYNVGRAILAGNLNGYEDLVTVESAEDFLNALSPLVLDSFNVAPIQPEKVRTIEGGIRTTLFDKLYLDAGYYFSFYRDFIGFQLGVDLEYDRLTNLPTTVQALRVAANATDQVTTQGFSLGLNYYFWNYYAFTGNYSFNTLNTSTDDPIIPAFNTPEHKFNIGIAGRDVPIRIGDMEINNFGFNINYKWIEGFLFEGSPQFTGFIPNYDLLDAQINWRAAKINTTFKLGASNLLDNQQFQTYGGPRIGRLAYFSVLYDFRKK
ncbi:MAG: TonB-dependent receptor [Bacteroidota bacterium]